MKDRKQRIEALLADLRALRRSTAFGSAGSGRAPRITPAQWGVLMHIEQCGESTVRDISRTFRISSSASTQLVNGLVRGGYLDRRSSPADRRVTTLRLSKKSKSRIERMKQEALQKFLALFKVLNDREFDQYLTLTKKLVTAKATSL